MTDIDELLFRACRDFVNDQSEGEWSTEQIDADARKMAEFINKVRPARPKLNMDVTPEIVAALDGSAAREDEAREVARLAAVLRGPRNALDHAEDALWCEMAVTSARMFLAEARKQVAGALP